MISLNKLKISTGLTTIFAIFFILIVFITGYNIYNSNKDYNAIISANNATEDARNLGSVKGNLATAMARLNRIIGDDLTNANTDEIFSKIHGSVELSQVALKKFMETPFYSSETEALGQKIKETAEQTYLLLKEAEAEAKANHTIVASAARLNALDTLDNVSTQYVRLNRAHGKLRAEAAQSSYISGIIISIIALVIALTLSILTWLWIRRQIVMRLAMVNSHLEEIGKGNLAAELESGANNEIGEMIHGMKAMQSSLIDLISQVRKGTENITVGAGEIASGNNDLSSRTEEQAAALQQTAASMEEIKMTVKQNADNANQANDLASNAKQLALEGGKAAEATRVIMDAIQESSKAISEINSVITSIASQTNILALNAAVEAARAGEQGRGFAVVAGEVRSLAQRSSTAAQEIRSLIDQTTTKVASGVHLVMETNQKIENAIGSVTKVSDLMEEIKTAAEEQNVGIAQVSQAITEMDTVTQQNAALVEQAAAASASLNEQAQMLSQEIAFFRLKEEDGRRKPAPLKRPEKIAPLKTATRSNYTSTPKTQADEDSWEEF